MFASEEDSDFSSGFGPSRLSNLFGAPPDDRYASNDSLSYTAPKQPRKQTILQTESSDKKPGPTGAAAAAGPAGASVVVIACAAHCYRLVNGQYASQGQVGVALLSSSTKTEYRILLYISQQKPVANATIHSNFSFAVQPNRYATIYDDARQPFSLLFEDDTKLASFAREVAIAKANITAAGSGGQLGQLVCQDLAIGSGNEVQNGDSVETRYTGSLFSSTAIGKEFDSNMRADKPFRVRVGKGSVIKGWDQGMLGMRPGGKRMLVVPPHLAYADTGVPGRIPPNSTLVFELELVKIRTSTQAAAAAAGRVDPASVPVADQLSGGAAATSAAAVQLTSTAQLPVVDTAEPLSIDAEQLRQRPSSFTEQQIPVQPQMPAAQVADKASLVNRMAKLGTAMLPMAGLPSHASAHVHRSGADVTEVTLQETQVTVIPRPDITTAFAMEGAPHGMSASGMGVPDQSLPSRGSTPAEVLGGLAPVAPQYQAAASGMSGMFGSPHDGSFVGQHGLLYDGTINVAAALAARQQNMAAAAALQTGGLTAAQIPVMGAPYGIVPSSSGLLQTGSWSDYSGHGRVAAPMTPTSRLPESVRIQSADTGNVPLIVQRMSEKIETLLSKVESLQDALGAPQSVMETAVVVQNIRRIADDNDKLKKDVAEKTAKIESQNLKISELLQQNQRAVEQSNEMLEQRNDTYKATASQAQNRVLLLEQEKVHMAEEISSLMSQLSQLQLQVAALKKKESDLSKEVAGVSSDLKATRDELVASNQHLSEKDIQLLDIGQKLKEEKRSRRDAETKLTEVTEEMNDLRSSRDSLQKALNERKRKTAEDRLAVEAEIENLELRHQEEVSSLKALLQKQSANSEQEVMHVEQLNVLWKRKLEDAVAAEKKKHHEEAASLRDESEQMKNEVADLKEAIQHLKQKASEVDRLRGEKAALATANDDLALQIQVRINEIQQLSSEKLALAARLNDKELEGAVLAKKLADQKLAEEQLAAAAIWKEKYDRLRQQASDMKSLYEGEIAKLKSTVTELEVSRTATVSNQPSQEPSMDKVKSVMNGVFQSFKREVNPAEQYGGSKVLQLVLSIIKRETLRLVETVADSGASSEDGEDSADSEEGDDKEEDGEDSAASEEGGDKEEEEEEEEESEEKSREQSEQEEKDEGQAEQEGKEDEKLGNGGANENIALDRDVQVPGGDACDSGDATATLAEQNSLSVKGEQSIASDPQSMIDDPVSQVVSAHSDGTPSLECRTTNPEPTAALPTEQRHGQSSSDSEEEGPQPPSDDNLDSDVGSGADLTFN